MVRGRGRKGLAALFAAYLGAGAAMGAETATVTVSKLKDLNIRMYGFVENDLILDSTEGLCEEQGNNAIPTRSTYAGSHQRLIESVRNSRLGFDLTLPRTESGLQSEAVIELDFLGNNAPNTTPGSTPGKQSERDFFNNPAARVRHAYINLTQDRSNLKIGQYWSLLGWQPYYFPAEPIVQPGVGQLYRRFGQVRYTHTLPMGGDWTFESAADIARPAEINAGVPEAHAGFRLASTRTKAAALQGSNGSMVGLSAAVSGAYIPVRTDKGNQNGGAVAFDVFIPILASPDGQSKSNNLSILGEFSAGEGVGGLELSGLTAGVPAAPYGGGILDSGVAGINQNGNVELIHFRTFRGSVAYTFPGAKWSASAGYAQVEALNLNRFSNALNGNGGGLGFIPRIQYGYLSLFYDPLAWLRVGAEYSTTQDTYNDPNNRYAINNRVQLTTYFVF